MAFTVWSRGELLGESDLDYVRVYPDLRTGDLRVTPKGMVVIDRLTQARSDCRATAKRVFKDKSQTKVEDSELKELFADMGAARDQEDALELELRAPDGSVIPTTDIFLQDTEYLLAIAAECDADSEYSEDASVDDALIAEDLAELEEHFAELEEDNPPWAQQMPRREPERFQISVMLANEWSIP